MSEEETIELSDVRQQYQSIKPEIDAAIANVLKGNRFIRGNYVERFETAFADYCGYEYCIGVANGTDAIEIALAAYGIVGKDVIIPANTAPATACAVANSGNKIVFCDCNESDFTIDTSRLENILTSRTAAIIPVHLYGNPCDMNAILVFAYDHGLIVIEDCAQSVGAKIKSRGHAATFSFYPSKNLGAFGDAGAIATSGVIVSQECRALADLGRIAKHIHTMLGRNSRLDEIQAAVLCTKLPYLDQWTNRRREIAKMYCDHLSQNYIPDSVYHQFPILVDDRDEVRERLLEKGIHTGIHYPLALPQQEAFYSEEAQKQCPVACRNADRLISLPIGIHLTDDDVVRVVHTLKEIL